MIQDIMKLFELTLDINEIRNKFERLSCRYQINLVDRNYLHSIDHNLTHLSSKEKKKIAHKIFDSYKTNVDFITNILTNINYNDFMDPDVLDEIPLREYMEYLSQVNQSLLQSIIMKQLDKLHLTDVKDQKHYCSIFKFIRDHNIMDLSNLSSATLTIINIYFRKYLTEEQLHKISKKSLINVINGTFNQV